MFLVLAETVLIRRVSGGSHFQPELFWSWRVWEQQREQILINVIMFVPVGVLAGLLWKWKGILVSSGLSMGIEVLQLISQKGLCEFDDVIHNAIGAVIGISLYMAIGQIKVKRKARYDID